MALIILAHPNFRNSLSNKTIIEELKKSHLELEFRNLHDLYPDFNIDIDAEQEALLRHETVVFQFPLYWCNVPSILKQWFDTVLAYQFAYGSHGDKLKGKNFLPSFTIGSREEAYRPLGTHHYRVSEYCKSIEHIAYYIQMNYIEPIYFHGSVHHFTEREVEELAKIHSRILIEKLLNLTK